MRSVELTFDDASDRAFRDVWAALDAADLPSSGRSTAPSNRPHVTLAAGAAIVPPAWPSSLVPPASVVLGGLTLFPAGRGKSVLVRSVVVDRALAAFHREVHAMVPGAFDQTVPDRWSPHVTLARRLTPDEVARAVVVLAQTSPPERATVAGVRFWNGDTRQVIALA